MVERRTPNPIKKRKIGDDDRTMSRAATIPLSDSESDSDFVIEQGRKKPGNIKVLLANTYSEEIDPTGWWISEKLDGVRAYWNGSHFCSRNGNIFDAPKFFKDGLPKTVSLDGELWVDRKSFKRSIQICKRMKKSNLYDAEAWREIKYVVFDCPSIQKPFEERMTYLKKLCRKLKRPEIICHTQEICRDKTHMEKELERVEELNGEGVMLREPGSMYENKRSDTLLKVKTFHDAEAVVYKIKRGEGRLQGMMGALYVKDSDGIEFKIGTGFSDSDRRKWWKSGTKVTYKYQEKMESGKPRFPIFLRKHPGV